MTPKRVAVLAVLALLAAGALSVAPAAWSKIQARIGVCETGNVITIAPEQQIAEGHAIWREWVVWHARKGDPQSPLGFEADVFAHHIPTGETRTLATGSSLQTIPNIHGTTVVWRDEPFDGTPVHLKAMDLATGREWTLDIPLEDVNLAVRGVYENTVLVSVGSDDGSRHGLHAFRMDTGDLQRLTNYTVGGAEVWGDRVVWRRPPSESPTGRSQLVLFDLAEGTLDVLLDSEAPLSGPDIYRDVVVYMKLSHPETRLGDRDVYALDLQTREERPVAVNDTGPAIQYGPRVAGEWMVYGDDRFSGEVVLYGYHLSTGQRVEVLRGYIDGEADVWGDRVVTIRTNPVNGHQNVVLTCI